MVIIYGSNGKVGTALREIFDEKGVDYLVSESWSTLLINTNSIVINCVAYTDVDGCENEMEYSKGLNEDFPAYLASTCRVLGAKLIHISSDYVFDGRDIDGYKEYDKPNPLNVYGTQKFRAEKKIHYIGGDYLIIRTSWLYGGIGKSFPLKVIEGLRYNGRFDVTSGIYCTPTSVKSLSRFIYDVIHSYPIFKISPDKICNFSGFKEVSLFEYARLVQNYSGLPGMINPKEYFNDSEKAYRPHVTSLFSTEIYDKKSFYDDLKEYIRSIV